jgi:hypothetical protein
VNFIEIFCVSTSSSPFSLFHHHLFIIWRLVMQVLGNTSNFGFSNRTGFIPLAKVNQTKMMNSASATDQFQFSNKARALTFQGVHKSVVNDGGKDLGKEDAEKEAWSEDRAPERDPALVGKVESDPLRNGTSYFFTHYHKGLYEYEKHHADSSGVKPARIEWIAGLSHDQAGQIYVDSRDNQG